MRIAFIGQRGIPAKYGGVEKYVEEVVKRLVKAGNEVIVYTRPNYTSPKLKEYEGVKLVSLPCLDTKHLEAISHTFLACLHVIFQKVDAVHFHSIGPSSLIWLVKLFKPRTPIVFSFHSQDYFHQKWGWAAKLYLKTGELVGCRFSDSIITGSFMLPEYVLRKYGKPSVYIPNGAVVYEPLAASLIKEKYGLEKDGYILAVSRLIRHKRLHDLIEAYKNLKTAKKLVIVGEGVHTDKYEQSLKEMSEGNPNIIFTGNQSGRVLAELYSNACLFVQPSESEGLSIALLEAMSYALPVLVSDIPENIEVVRDLGESFVKNDVGDLGRKLAQMLHDEAKMKESGIRLRKRVEEEYDWDRIAMRIEDIYHKAADAKCHRMVRDEALL